ncbi:hypothetical protein AOXY_G10675 [Acipenser oxyrinchus oxyrinchus]|uniref:Uncharacterized protein n=1 Tax=Acipenser oxyrinchus oxyrinchus TaxID=40147 RepID=A0AAD8DEI6_ACIOX|nr:hypothetical protein AOXY_G10675 [Acipenser oxyrinchus oxyrinchus]
MPVNKTALDLLLWNFLNEKNNNSIAPRVDTSTGLHAWWYIFVVFGFTGFIVIVRMIDNIFASKSQEALQIYSECLTEAPVKEKSNTHFQKLRKLSDMVFGNHAAIEAGNSLRGQKRKDCQRNNDPEQND